MSRNREAAAVKRAETQTRVQTRVQTTDETEGACGARGAGTNRLEPKKRPQERS